MKGLGNLMKFRENISSSNGKKAMHLRGRQLLVRDNPTLMIRREN